VGKAKKWRSPFFGVGWWCGVREANATKANYLKNIFAPFLSLFYNSPFFSLICQIEQNFQPYLTLLFRFPIALRSPPPSD
jgi:hypothetical protein